MDAVKQLQCTGESPITKNYLAQNVNSAENETLLYMERDKGSERIGTAGHFPP